jgi:alcohol dehydrogenase
MARAAGAGARAVVAADPSADARSRAVRFGATDAVPPDELGGLIAELTAGRGADVAVELAGTADSVRAGLDRVRTGGTVVLAGTVAPTPAVPLDPEAVVRRWLTLRGVHNYHPRDLGAALDFLAGPGREYPFAELAAADFPLDRVEEAFAAAHARPGVRVAVVP